MNHHLLHRRSPTNAIAAIIAQIVTLPSPSSLASFAGSSLASTVDGRIHLVPRHGQIYLRLYHKSLLSCEHV